MVDKASQIMRKTEASVDLRIKNMLEATPKGKPSQQNMKMVRITVRKALAPASKK